MREDKDIEQMITDKKLNAPRVTLDQFETNIEDIEILKHITQSGSILRWAIITTKNGFSVTGRPSACVSIENDNAEVGEKIAISNAKNELWPLMGYALAESMKK